MKQAHLLVLSALSIWAGSISGVVVDETGASIRRSHVIATRQNGDKSEAIADEAGRFIVGDLKPGTYSIEISSPGFIEKTIEDINVTEEETRLHSVKLSVRVIQTCEDLVTPVVVFTPAGRDSAVSARVLLGSATRAAGARIIVYSQKGNRQIRSMRPDVDGNFTVTGLPEGKYQIRVRHPGYAELIVDGVEVRKGFKSEVLPFSLTPCQPGTTCPAVKWIAPPTICL
jgi:hypothetical protein